LLFYKLEKKEKPQYGNENFVFHSDFKLLKRKMMRLTCTSFYENQFSPLLINIKQRQPFSSYHYWNYLKRLSVLPLCVVFSKLSVK
jgi:hypothetical protein